MRNIGVYALLFGIADFVLPLVGFQLSILSLFGEYLYYVAGGLIVLGVLLLGLSMRQSVPQA